MPPAPLALGFGLLLIAISSKYSANGSGRSISSASRQGKICSEAGEMPSPRRGRPEGSPAWSAQRRGTLGFRRAEAVSPRSGRSTPARFAEPFPKLPVPGVDHPLRGFAFSDAVPRVPPRNKRSASPWKPMARNLVFLAKFSFTPPWEVAGHRCCEVAKRCCTRRCPAA